MWITCIWVRQWVGNTILICFWHCRNPLKMSARANSEVESFCNKIILPYTSTSLPCMLCVIVGINCYHTDRVFWTWRPAIIIFFFKTWKWVEGSDIYWSQWAKVSCGGVLQKARFIVLPLGYKCTTEAVDQVYRVTRRLYWIKYLSYLWLCYYSYQR